MGGIKTKNSKKDLLNLKSKPFTRLQSYSGPLIPISVPYVIDNDYSTMNGIKLYECLCTVGFKQISSENIENSVLTEDLLKIIFSYPKSISFLGKVGLVCQYWFD